MHSRLCKDGKWRESKWMFRTREPVKDSFNWQTCELRIALSDWVRANIEHGAAYSVAFGHVQARFFSPNDALLFKMVWC
ncbi:MAG: hypothetical protein EOP83_04175 [Verrucomicrobiaceae bacterium]|nr:MAG: hypothetical protein EOP83_04175 [Verrucomicrobiaceae bacterium]